MQDRYLDPHQARQQTPTEFENLLGDSLERAYAQGLHELEEVVNYLNQAGPSYRDGQPWTEANFRAELARLGA